MRNRSVLVSMVVISFILLGIWKGGIVHASSIYSSEAEWLKQLDLFKGTASGFELDRQLTRAEAAVLIVRVLGKEDEAILMSESLPFLDVPVWAYPAVSYIYTNRLGTGLSTTEYGAYSYVSASQYATMLLRGMGYREELGDFPSNTPLDKLLALNAISKSQLNELKTKKFTRGHVALLTYQILKTATKDSGKLLADTLIEQGIVSYAEAKKAGLIAPPLKLLTDMGGIEVYRPAYGTLNISINSKQLSATVAGYASIALQSYDQLLPYNQAVKQLKDGSFDYKQFFETNKLEGNSPAQNDSPTNRLYTHELDKNGALLLDNATPKKFSYVMVFYDVHRNPIFYKYIELPQITDKLSANPKIIALMYHHFSEKKEDLNSLIVDPNTFRAQLQALKAEGFVSIRQQDLLAFLKGDKRVKLPEKSVIITIDDGYESNYKLAYPILVKEKVYATIFAIAKHRDHPVMWAPHFNWQQALEMYNSGYIDIQNHTYNSHYYGDTDKGTATGAATTSRLLINKKLETKAQFEKRISDDLMLSKTLIEQFVGNKVIAFAFPFGRNNQSLINQALASGHSLMYTVQPGMIKQDSNANQLPRLNVDGKYSAKDLILKIKAYLK